MHKLPNILLIAGMGRNVGKTTLACKLIAKYSKNHPVTAIKITPHFHDGGCEKILETESAIISIENRFDSPKDSSRMLHAGAHAVYFIQSNDADLIEILPHILKLIPKNKAVIIESAALGKFIKPGLLVLMRHSKAVPKNQHLLTLADFEIVDYNYNISDFEFKEGVWRKRLK